MSRLQRISTLVRQKKKTKQKLEHSKKQRDEGLIKGWEHILIEIITVLL
jgi:hypothetical protein